MAKKKIELEYEMNTLPRVLFNQISTPEGLASWFADEVSLGDGKMFTFAWEGEISRAFVVKMVENEMIRLRWEDDDKGDYFEFRITVSEMSRGCLLHVIDFSEEEEADEVVRLWNFQIEVLKRCLGA